MGARSAVGTRVGAGGGVAVAVGGGVGVEVGVGAGVAVVVGVGGASDVQPVSIRMDARNAARIKNFFISHVHQY